MRTNIRPFLRFAAFFLVLALAVALANTCLIQTDTFVALMMDELKNSRDIELAVVLLGLARLFSQRAVVALHGEMKIGVVVLNGVKITQVGDFYLQLFHELASYGVLGRLAAHELAAGELPKSLHVAIAALHGKQLIGSFLANDPSGNMNSLQQESSLNINT